MRSILALLPVLAGCAAVETPPRATPFLDAHQHLVSQTFEPVVKLPAREGAALVRDLDAAGIERAVVLSVGYSLADERKKLVDPDRLTREENDWTSAEVMKNAPRLIGFCSSNPFRAEALRELERCLDLPGMTGIKMHFGNSGVSLRNPAHLQEVQRIFALAVRHKAPVLVHMRARGGLNYGAEDVRIFLDQVVANAADIEIVVGHLGGSGPGYDAQNDEVMAVFGEAGERRDPRLRNVYFDVATNVTDASSPTDAALVARRIRQVGSKRILYGSDLSPPGGSVRSGWEIFRMKVPLTPIELQTIANNRPRFAR